MLEILAITGPIYLIILIGVATVHFGLFQKADVVVLGKLVLNLALPCLMFNALSQRNIQEIINLNYLLGYTLGTLLLMGLAFLWARRWAGLNEIASVYAVMGMSCPNSGFIGFPILLLTLPTIAASAFALNLMVENLLVIPLLLLLAETAAHAGTDRRQMMGQLFRRLLSNPLILALIAGILAAWLQLRLPAPFSQTITLIAQTSSAVSLLAIGGALVGLPLDGMGRRVFPIALGKLILHPLAVFTAFAVLAALGLSDLADDMRQASILFAAMPSMSIYPLFAQRHSQGGVSAAALLATTLGSFLTINLLLWLLHSGWL